MIKLRILLAGFSAILALSGCMSEQPNSAKTELQNWSDSVLTKYEDLSRLRIDSTAGSNQETKRRRIRIYSADREDYLLIDESDTLVHTIDLNGLNQMSIVREICVPNKNPKDFTRIILDGKRHGVERSYDCDLDSLIVQYFYHGQNIEQEN
jgi:hypothetical protein